ncbi:cytochrome P450 71B25 [Acephala macrosclerotiorum]|nr:cytochrome P450 71B25 [Acephala macrosclerotiorum]
MVFSVSLHYGPYITAFVVAWLSSIAYVVVKGWNSRTTFYKLQKQGVPMPRWNPVTGHILSLAPILKNFPLNVHQNYLIAELSKQFNKSDSAFYLDLWPFSLPFLVVSSPSMAIQACQTYDLGKPKALDKFFSPFAGGSDNLFVSNGPQWKRSRAIFNPGFNSNYLLTQMDHIVEETSEFVEILGEHANEGDIFSLDDLLCDFTMDIIGAVTINSRLLSQRQFNPLASSMRSQVRWHLADGEFNPFKRMNPIRPLMQWYNGNQMDKYVSKELDKRFAERRLQDDSPSRSIIDLVLDNYFIENPSARSSLKMDPVFKKWAMVQIRLFLFAGHDSTASTITYCYHLLSKHPEAMGKTRAEHDEVFGKDLTTVKSQLLEQPHKINFLPYTTAVIKEAMRLFPAAAAVRTGEPGAVLQDSDGNDYSTEGMIILVLHIALQRNPKYWKEPEAFIPERWLVGPEDPLYPPKGGWRPFEFGPRNCIGSPLVMQDVKTVLVMTLREFDIRAAYDEWDVANPRKGNKTAWGERAYQVFVGAAHPADGFPCRVAKRA